MVQGPRKTNNKDNGQEFLLQMRPQGAKPGHRIQSDDPLLCTQNIWQDRVARGMLPNSRSRLWGVRAVTSLQKALWRVSCPAGFMFRH